MGEIKVIENSKDRFNELVIVNELLEVTHNGYSSKVYLFNNQEMLNHGNGEIFLEKYNHKKKERFNSWDFFTHPMALLKYVLHSFSNPTAILMTFEFSVFIGFAYCMLHSLIHLNDR